MSHFTTVKTVIRDQIVLEDTLRQLHYDFKVGETLAIRGYQGNRTTGQIVVNTGSDYDIGFQKQANGSFDICADWWGVQGNTDIKQDDFIREVNRNYSHIAIRRQVAEQGYIMETEKALENGEIEIVVCEPI